MRGDLNKYGCKEKEDLWDAIKFKFKFEFIVEFW